MSPQPSSLASPAQLVIAQAKSRLNFLTDADVRVLAADPKLRLTPCLVRCGSCRFTAPAQDIKHLVDIIERDGRDYVRDVSLPPGDVPEGQDVSAYYTHGICVY